MKSAGISSMVVGVVTVVVMVVAMGSLVAAVTDTGMSCVSNLAPCLNYLNSTSPPETCCNPLKAAVTSDLACLCAAFKNPALLRQAGVNATQAAALPMHCGIKNADVTMCDKLGVSPAASPSAPTTVPPPGKSAANKFAKTGSVFSLLLIVASLNLGY